MRSLLSVLFVIGLASASTTVSEAASQYKANAAESRLSQWNSLNLTLGGRLQKGVPVSAPCFPIVDGKNVTVNHTTCAAVQAGYTQPLFRAPTFGAYMYVSAFYLKSGIVGDNNCNSLSGRVVNQMESSVSLIPAIHRTLRLGLTFHARKAQSHRTTFVNSNHHTPMLRIISDIRERCLRRAKSLCILVSYGSASIDQELWARL